jgi:hypothetical protein
MHAYVEVVFLVHGFFGVSCDRWLFGHIAMLLLLLLLLVLVLQAH